MLKLPALSIRQPWAAMIVHCGKQFENRTWPTRFRGPFLIHAAKGMTDDEYRSAIRFAHETCGIGIEQLRKHCGPSNEDLAGVRGGIVGYANMADCVSAERHASLKPHHRSPWFMGPYGFYLTDVQELPFLPVTGRLGFFEVEVPDDYLPAHLRPRLAA